MLLDKFILPTFGDQRIDRITNENVNAWYDELAPGRETIRAQSYSLLRTIFASAASERPTPIIPYNPAHIRGAGGTKRAHQVQPATLAELETPMPGCTGDARTPGEHRSPRVAHVLPSLCEHRRVARTSSGGL